MRREGELEKVENFISAIVGMIKECWKKEASIEWRKIGGE